MNGEVSDVVEQAMKIMEGARFLEVPATGEVLAEIPGQEWDFWALGGTREHAATVLTNIIARTLLRRLKRVEMEMSSDQTEVGAPDGQPKVWPRDEYHRSEVVRAWKRRQREGAC